MGCTTVAIYNLPEQFNIVREPCFIVNEHFHEVDLFLLSSFVTRWSIPLDEINRLHQNNVKIHVCTVKSKKNNTPKVISHSHVYDNKLKMRSKHSKVNFTIESQ